MRLCLYPIVLLMLLAVFSGCTLLRSSRKTPPLEDDDSRLIYEFATVFYTTRDVPDRLFADAVARFGRRSVVELAGVLGYYSGLAMLLRIFRVSLDKTA